MTETAILGAAVGYEIEQLEAFLRSCDAAAPNADVFIFTDKSSANETKLARQYCGRCVLIRPSGTRRRQLISRLRRGRRVLSKIELLAAKCLHLIQPNRSKHSSLVTGAFGVAIARYLWYLDWIKSAAANYYRNVLLTDTRDVIFQRDPFTEISTKMLWCGEEPILMKDCEINKAWYVQAYLTAGFERIATYPVLCSGVTGGPRAKVEEYLEAMCRAILQVGSRIVLHPGYDQAIHNHILRLSDLSGCVTFFGAESSNLATMHNTPVGSLCIADDQSIRTGDGTLISIVHQYDRHQELRRSVNQRFTRDRS
jgi:hypothetical protein